ncbi:MAG: VUT family protein, partial [Pseudomonadota bacterium]|nr:VUT family protein [Pseudomonadota bacterium]
MIEQKAETAFSILMGGFVVFLVLTNIIGVKLFLAFPEWLPNGFFGEPITLTTGILTYPITFLVTDIVCEVYGRRRANLMVFTGFVMSLLSLVLIQIA